MTALPDNVEIFMTADGSPTLNWRNGHGQSEKMHHSGGALSESLYIYYEALCEVVARGWPRHILSLGLGLGYNEWISLAEVYRSTLRGSIANDWSLISFESEPFLRQGFLTWLSGRPSPLVEVSLADLFDRVLLLVCNHFNLNTAQLKEFGHSSLQNGSFEVRARFPENALDVKARTCIFYDAFSKNMDPELWIEDEIKRQFETLCAKTCVVASYAATGNLNRSLRTLGFRRAGKAGFNGKRQSTLAIREEIR